MTEARARNQAASYRRTTLACFVSITVQAVVCNVTAVLFLPVMEIYGLRYVDLGILTGVNFAAQVTVDIVFSHLIDKLGYRRLILPALGGALGGLILFALAPTLFPTRIFAGLLLATVVFSLASGLLEILLSPIVDAIPGGHKGAAMSLMHSFYAWGQASTIALTTLAVFLFGGENWRWFVAVWALVPLAALLLFLKAPLPKTKPVQHAEARTKTFLSPFFLTALLAIFFGAGAELVMAQWASTFFERALHLPKLAGDLVGLTGFALMMGLGRLLYGIYGSKISISAMLIGGGLLAAACYASVALSPAGPVSLIGCAVCGIAVSQLWPGTLVVTAEHFPAAGAWLFAYLAVSGDVGASFGTWLTGVIVESGAAKMGALTAAGRDEAALRSGLLLGVILSLGAAFCHILLRRARKHNRSV